MDESFGNDDNHRDNLDEMLHDAKSNVDEKNVKNYSNCLTMQKNHCLKDASRYKHHKNLTELDSDVTKNGPPAKMLSYLPIIPRLKKLYANPKDAKLLRWHAEERKTDGKMRHVADSPQWKNIDRLRQPGNDINVYLRPLIDDMIDLWEIGVEIYDAYKKERFQLFAMIYCTINDFPAYGHRRALHRHHPYRKKENLFDGTSKDRSMPKLMDGYATLSQVADLNITFGKKVKAPPKPCYTLSKAEKTSFCECLRGIKVPSGYSANIKNLVSMKDLKLLDVLSTFFFDVMVHLVSHIVEEIKIAGLVFLRYMYPFERYMGFLKGYVRNRYRPEGSIIQGYVAEEVVQFCTKYMDDVTDIGLLQSRHQGRLEGVGTIGRKDVTPNIKDLEQAHFIVLQNMTCIEPYIQDHMSYLARKNGRREQRWLEAEHKKTFSQWLADKVIAKQVDQVFYVEDLLDKRWHIVPQSKRSIVGVDDVVDEDEYNKFDELPPFSIGFQSDAVLSDTFYLRSDHQEGQED
nr:hypothetical protein [Tanacetum cinerariifolium]